MRAPKPVKDFISGLFPGPSGADTGTPKSGAIDEAIDEAFVPTPGGIFEAPKSWKEALSLGDNPTVDEVFQGLADNPQAVQNFNEDDFIELYRIATKTGNPNDVSFLSNSLENIWGVPKHTTDMYYTYSGDEFAKLTPQLRDALALTDNPFGDAEPSRELVELQAQRLNSMFGGDKFKSLPPGARQQLIDLYAFEGGDLSGLTSDPNDVAALMQRLRDDMESLSGTVEAEIDGYVKKFSGALGLPPESSYADMVKALEENPSKALSFDEEQWDAYRWFAENALDKGEHAAHMSKLYEGVPAAKPSDVIEGGAPAIVEPVRPIGLPEYVPDDALSEYQNTMGRILMEQGAVPELKDGAVRYTATPQQVNEAIAMAREQGIRPLSTEARDKADELARSLNYGMRYGVHSPIDEERMVGVDWGRVHEMLDLDMTDSARMARAREQGHVYGIDEELWRGVNWEGNRRDFPGMSNILGSASLNPSGRDVTQWASSEPDIALSYTGARPDQISSYLGSLSGQDYAVGMPNIVRRHSPQLVDPNVDGPAMYRTTHMGTPYEYQGIGERFNDLKKGKLTYEGYPEYDEVYSDDLFTTDDAVRRAAFRASARGEPSKGVVFRNIVDPGSTVGGRTVVSDVYATPLARTRMRDYAMYHPLTAGRRSLLGSVAGATVAPYYLGQPQEMPE